MSEKPCAMLVYDREASAREHRLVIRACRADARYVLTLHGDTMFRVCHRHDSRLARAGVAFRG